MISVNLCNINELLGRDSEVVRVGVLYLAHRIGFTAVGSNENKLYFDFQQKNVKIFAL